MILARARTLLEAHWRSEGHTVPNPTTYPWQWLWDSCFHALVWLRLGDERAMIEIASSLSDIGPSGFVAHMRYPSDPGFASAFWGRSGTSCITQPPMYGHVVAELVRAGAAVPEELVDRAGRALRFLTQHRARTASGLIQVVHPWETGCDDSTRWDAWRSDPEDLPAWYDTKGDLVRSIRFDSDGGPIDNPAFRCAPVGFNALVAFNSAELASVTGDDELRADADEIGLALSDRWDPARATWVDDGDGASTSGGHPTLDGLLPALVTDVGCAEALAAVVDPEAFLGPFGIRGTSSAHPTYRPDRYWRGPAWPQLEYLVALAASRSGQSSVADVVATATVSGTIASGWAEYRNAESGSGLGAIPQSWAALAAVTPGTPDDREVASRVSEARALSPG